MKQENLISLILIRCNFFVVCICFLLLSCCNNKNEDVFEDIEKERLNQKIQSDTTCLGITIVRSLVEQEIQKGGLSIFLEDIQGYTLSNTPRIIFAYDNRPKYYEFDILVNNQPKATITAFAQKEEEACIAFIFKTPLKRKHKQNLVMYEGFYPTVYWGELGEYGDKPLTLYKEDGVTLVDEIPSIYEDERYEKIISKMDIQSAIQARKMITYNKEMRLKKYKRVLNYWNNRLNNLNNDINNNSNTYISTKDNGGIHDDDLVNGIPSTYYVIPAFNNAQLKKTSWSGPCGPGVVAWVYRGLYSYYPCTSTSANAYIRKYGDSPKQANINSNIVTIFFNTFSISGVYYDKAMYNYSPYCADIYNKVSNNASRQIDNGLYERLLDHTVKTGSNYPMYQAGMNNAIKEITNDVYSITTTVQSRSHIENNHLPVFIMIGTGDSFHYLVAFGTGSIDKKDYIFVTDNGSYISGNAYYPYWRYEGSNYGIRYKLKK